jgi:hypothetical protein
MTLQAEEPGNDALDPAFADYLLDIVAGTLPAAGDEAGESLERHAVWRMTVSR